MNRDVSLRKFEGAVAVVTGGGPSGMGRALGETLVGGGARVVLAELRVDLSQAVAVCIPENGGHATAAPLDVPLRRREDGRSHSH
jgi:NAD(P)-dependent dehydrogenase (short-subunit alcohol dehydrogenase family)